jgi:glycosyltransferase involved in cell wall biosynthesis
MASPRRRLSRRPTDSVRVLHIQRVKGIGGSERHLLTLLPALARRGVDVKMCVLQMDGGERFVDALRRANIDVTTRKAGFDANPALLPGLVSDIRSYRPDVVHTHLVHADVHGLLAARVARVATVSSVHGTPAFYRREPYRSAGRLAGRLANRRIAISEHVATFLRAMRLAPPDRIRVVYYGIDADTLGVGPGERDKYRSRFGIASDDVTLGIASRLVPGKGHDLLVDSFARASSSNPKLRLLIAGDGPERSRLEAQSARCCSTGAIQFLGFVEQIRGFLAACDALVFPTLPELSEGFGLAALEAMAASRPVIATDVGSLPEVVEDGTTGIVVRAGSAQALASAIATIAADRALRERLGNAGAERARSAFPLDRMVSDTINVYEEVI